MIKKISVLLLALAGMFAGHGIDYGFTKDGSGPYGIWSKSLAKAPTAVELREKAGVNGSNALVIADVGKKGFKIAADDIYLVPGKKYRFGGWVKTENLKARRIRFVIHNRNWQRDLSTRVLPADTKGKWVKIEETGVMIPSSGLYTFCLHVDKPVGGKLEISSPYVEEIKPADLLPVQSYSFTAKTDPEHKSGADPGFRKLTDGITVTDQVAVKYQGGKGVTWRHKLNGGKGPVITFNFASPVKIDKVHVHYFRWKRSYGIKEIRVVGVEGDKRLLLGNLVLNHPFEKPAADPFHSVAEIVSASDQKFSTVEVHFKPTGGWITLDEVEFFGKADPAAAPAPDKKASVSAGEHPLAAELTSQPAAGLKLSKKKGMIVLENDQVIYVLDPGYTGSVNFAWDRESKSNQAVYAKPKSGFGPMFCDRLYPGNYDIRDMYRYLPYQAEILADGPDKKQVRLSGSGRTGFFRNVKMVKTYTLYADSPVLHVDQAIQNGQENVIPLRYGYWMCGGSQNPNGCRLVIPAAASVDVYNYVRQLSVREASSGWMAAMDGKSDSALALLMPYDLLSEFYFWRENNFIGTMEFKLGVYPVKAGDELRFKTALVPFSRIGIPAKVTEIAALSFGDPLKNPELKMQLFDPRGGTLRLSAGFMNKGKVSFETLFDKPVAAGTKRFQCEYKLPEGKGTLVLKAELLRNGIPVMFAETSCILGKATGVWKLTPDCERKPDINAGQAKANLDFHSLAVETPHVKWGKPYAGGRPKVLAVNFGTGGIREMIELAQRFDIDLTTNFTSGMWALSGHVMSLSVKDCVSQLGDKLKKRYDVIVVAGLLWKYLPENISSALLEQVSAGTGLVVISPEGYPKQLQALFSKAKKGSRKAVRWQAADGNTFFTGIPLDILPATRINPYQIRNGELLASAEKMPLAARFQYGKGKVFLTTYLDKLPISSRNSTFFLPFLHHDDPHLTWHYYEYHYGMLARMIYAAAGKDAGVEVTQISAKPNILTLEVGGPSGEAEITVTLRDKFSRAVGTVKQKIGLTPEKKQVTVALPDAVMSGLHFADTVISVAKGKAWWGTAYFDNRAPGSFAEVKIPDRIFRQEEKIAPEIKLNGSGEVTAKLYDNYGNVFAQETGSAPALPLTDCLSPACKLELTLRKDGREIDRFVKDINSWRKPDPRFFLIAQGWPGVREKTPLYLTDFYTGLLHRHYGINCTSGSWSSWDTDYVAGSYRRNDVLIFSRETGGGTGGKYPFNRNLKKPTKFELIRKPCLSDPAVLERIRSGPARNRDSAPGKYGNILAAGADEANMFGGWDGCFSPHCMKAIRIWLRQVYGSLDKLNASWKTDFKTWDEVIPMTEAEVRNHGSYAPWVDHRTFNDIQRAAAIGIQTASIEKHTGLWLSLSGTSNTNPWNAWDYYRIMPHMKALAGYFGEQTIQHRSFAKSKLFSMPWIGYDTPYDEHNMSIIRSLMNGVSGLNIYGTFYIGPDWDIPPRGVQLKKVLGRYLDGRADAIMQFDPMVYPIAFHYTPASIKVNYLEGKNDIRVSSTSGFRNILNDCALNYNYLAYGEIEQGQFGKYKVVFLPMSSALSDAEVKNLKTFVENGGILIADLGAGHFDDHGVRRPDRKDLLEIFGLASFGKIRKTKAVLQEKGPDLKGISLPVENAEIGLRADKAQAKARVTGDFGSMDAVYVHSFGKGKAVYLAADISSTIGNQGALRYTGKHAVNTRTLEDFFRRIFADAGITPLIQAPTLRSTELLVRERNGAFIAGFVRDIDQTRNTETSPSKHTISTARKFHVWDLLERRYLGYGDRFQYEFGPVTQSIWVLLPYKPEALTARAAGKDRSWIVTLAFKADTDRFTRHILNLRLKDRNGRINGAYPRKVIMDDGKCEVRIKLPLNHPADGWTLEAEDVLTQCKTEIELK